MITLRWPTARWLAMLLTVVITGAAIGQNRPPESDEPLFMQTLPLDISTASVAELAAWLRQLELPDGGERFALQERLLDHYGLARPDESPEDDTGARVTVESARSIRSRSDEHGHTTTVLEGEVAISAVDRDTGVRHLINADRITYHEERNSLTASGSVVYTVVTENGREVFYGESLSVDTDRWGWIFYDGSSRIDQLVDETELSFAYTGRSIIRHDADTMVLEDATVTSSEDANNPYYRIQAERLWILAPQEWAVRNAFLHIGEVPVLYLPYFLRPGGKLLFHPAIGQRGREGTYLQTTTYLIGRKFSDDTSPAFLQRDDLQDQYADQLLGLFLVPERNGADAGDADPESLALMLDLYTRLGVFAGLQGRFSGLSLFGGIAASRTLVEDTRQGVGYTPYLQGAGGKLVSHWDTTRILGATVPLRYGLELEFERLGALGSLQGGFELFSDPSFTTDFLGRAHDLPTGGLIGLPQGPLIPPPSRDRLEWRLGGDLRLHPLIATPVFSTLALPTLSARWLWRSRTEPQPAATKSAAVLLQAASPTSRFYYPVTLALPVASAVAAGSLYRLENEEGGFSAHVGYALRPVVSVDHRFDNKRAVTRDQVGQDILYTRVDTRVTGQITYSASAFDQVIGLNGALAEAARYQVHTRRADGIDSQFAERLRQSDLSRTSSSLRLDNTVSLRPLLSVPELSGSSLSYGLGLTLHEVNLDADTAHPIVRGLAWDRDRVRSHRAEADLVFAVTNLRARLGAGVDLPPLRLAADGRLDVEAEPFSMTLRGGVAERENGADAGQFRPTPLDGRGTLRIGPNASVTQSVRLDERQRLERLSTQANAFGLTGMVRASVREPLDAFGDTVAGARPSLRATQLAFGYRLDTGTLDYWRNRILLDAGIQTRLAVDPEAYVRNNSLSLDLQLDLRIHKFLELSFASRSVNRHLFRYFPDKAAQAGERWVNPIVDLLRSFNFFNPNDRIASAFKLESLRLEALHRLGDWNLSLAYQGRLEQHTELNPATGHDESHIIWAPALSIEVRWVPLPELYSSFRVDRQGIDINEG